VFQSGCEANEITCAIQSCRNQLNQQTTKQIL
jgi:hypothetical protein